MLGAKQLLKEGKLIRLETSWSKDSDLIQSINSLLDETYKSWEMSIPWWKKLFKIPSVMPTGILWRMMKLKPYKVVKRKEIGHGLWVVWLRGEYEHRSSKK